MRTLSIFNRLIAFFIFAIMHSSAAVLILDSFSEGSVNIEFGVPSVDSDTLTNAPLQARRVSLSGDRDYHATSESGSGILNYTVNLRGDPSGESRMVINYQNLDQSLFSLMGIEGFGLTILDLQGSGELNMYVDSIPALSITIPLTESGYVFYPVTNLRGAFDLSQLGRIGFRFIATSPNFSITLDEISAIPEPSALVLLSMGGLWGLVRRRRKDWIKIG